MNSTSNREPAPPLNPRWAPPAPTGTPYAEGGPIPVLQPTTQAERDRLTERYFNAMLSRPPGWYTVPGFVRVAVWLWALVTVLGFAAGLLFSLVWVIILMVTLGAQ